MLSAEEVAQLRGMIDAASSIGVQIDEETVRAVARQANLELEEEDIRAVFEDA